MKDPTSWIMWYLLRHQITLPCLPEQCRHGGKNFSRRSSLSKHRLLVHGASRPTKIMQDRYLAKLMVHRRTSFAICYITLKTRISFREHMKKCAHLLAPEPLSVEGGFAREFMLLLDGISVRGQSTREKWFTSVMSVPILFNICQRLTSTYFGST